MTDSAATTEAADLRKLLHDERAKTLAFFDALAQSAKAPHANDRTKDETKRLLALAVEAGIYGDAK